MKYLSLLYIGFVVLTTIHSSWKDLHTNGYPFLFVLIEITLPLLGSLGMLLYTFSIKPKLLNQIWKIIPFLLILCFAAEWYFDFILYKRPDWNRNDIIGGTLLGLIILFPFFYINFKIGFSKRKIEDAKPIVINKKLFILLVYISGILTPVFVLILLGIFGIIPHQNKHSFSGLHNWQIEECNETFLYINKVWIQKDPNICFSIVIERDPNTKLLKRLGIVSSNKGKKNPVIFSYQSDGLYDLPMACYGSSEFSWRDFNFDGKFDEIIDYEHNIKKIPVNECWIQGLGKDDIYTEKGIFQFDPNIGEWKQVAEEQLNDK